MSRPREKRTSAYKKNAMDEWILSDWFCPACGRRDMWQLVGRGGDYYHDYEVTCKACGHLMCCVDEVRDEKEKPAPWWDEVSRNNLKAEDR